MEKDVRPGMTRREFAKTSAIASFAILSSRSCVAEANSETLKVGLLGCGNRGTGAAINMLEGNDNVKLVAMADLFPDRLAGSKRLMANHENLDVRSKFTVEDELCFTGLDAYEKILSTDIDIIIEGTLPYCRPTHIEAAVKAKKHIFTEKPVAVDPHGVNKILVAAEKHKKMGLSFVAGTQRRHQREYIETIQKIHDGAIGEVMSLRAYWCSGLPFAFDRRPEWGDLECRIRNWYAYCWVAGDNIVEQHVH
ncbi:MAG TPA: Gfo/Idh/MocA family oxidoreductase, partial [Candidatus Hydrogenedentes bacterium]|nr:Gfo/Idh/MocA family oxidoreductase [Candidatus Hydrogenedentota bacterium]